jgi:hypothetical protein
MIDGMRHYIEKSIEKIDELGFSLVLYNGGVSMIENVSFAYMALSRDRSYSMTFKRNSVQDKALANPDIRDNPYNIYLDAYIDFNFNNYG